MKFRAIIFDLFGTLVPDFAPSRYEEIYMRMAAEVEVPYEKFREGFGGTFGDRTRGRFATIAENVEHVCITLGRRPSPSAIEAAAAHRREFSRTSMTPSDDVLDALRSLRAAGLKLGLLTNCGPDVAEIWSETPLAPYIDEPTFSCCERMAKPDLLLYRSVCERLGHPPEACLYVGDGSDMELTGALEAGLTPILKRTDLRDVYDRHRPDVAAWSGHAIDEIGRLTELLPLLSSHALPKEQTPPMHSQT